MTKRNVVRGFFAILAVIMATISIAGAQAAPSTPSPAAPNCRMPTGWAAVEQRKPRYVFFGEWHGTAQRPAFVEQVACALVASGKTILLGIEFDATLDPQLQDVWAKPQAQFADALRTVGWAGRRDGVASKAMFEMLVQLHALKDMGAPIAIVAFNGVRDAEQERKFAALPGQGPHEAAQAENIALASQARAYDLTLVLVGDSHARLQPVSFAGASYAPMAMHLATTGAVISLQMKSAGGTAWNCQLRPGFSPISGQSVRTEDVVCASRPLAADPEPQPVQSIVLHHRTGADFDGAFWLSHVDGSPPADATDN